MPRSENIRTWDQIIADLDRLTGPMGTWTIERNQHRSCYRSVAEELSIFDEPVYDFENEAEAERARRENQVNYRHLKEAACE